MIAADAVGAEAKTPGVRGGPRPVTPSAILAVLLGDLVRKAEATGGVDAVWLGDLCHVRDLAAGLDPYLSRWTTQQSPELRRLAERTAAQDWGSRPGDLEQEMLSGHVEGQLLKMFVHASRARNVLEVGMFTGYSALAMAEALPDDGRVIACEIDPEVAHFARRCFDGVAAGHKIDVRVGPAVRTLEELAGTGECFELIFLDADKAGYRGYLDLILDGDLLAPHGLICVDNTLMQGQPWTTGESTANGRAIAEFNEAVAADRRIEQVIVPLRDGLTLIRRTDRPDEDAARHEDGLPCSTGR